MAVPRTIEALPALSWWFALGYAFAGWVMANLRNAVVAMNNETDKLAAGAGVLATFVASHVVGVSLCLYVLTEARIDGKPVSALLAYVASAVGAFGGMKLMELGVEALKTIALRWAQRGTGGTNES